MPTVRYFDRQITSAVVLGVAALLTNFLSYVLLLDHSMPAGNIFLFCSAGALGIPGAVVSGAIGIIPEALYSGDLVHGTRIFSLCLVLGFCSSALPRIPSFAISIGLWLFVYAPLAHLFAGTPRFPAPLDASGLMMAATSEVLFTMIAGALLLNTDVWGTITHRPRHVSLQKLLIHFFTIAATVAMLAAFSLRVRPGGAASDAVLMGDVRTIVILLGMAVLLPSFMAWRLAKRLQSDSQELLELQSLHRGSAKTFSGLSSEFWRRQSSDAHASMRPTTVIPMAPGEAPLSSSGDMPLPSKVSGSPVQRDQGICALNRNGTVTFMNRRFKSYSGVQNNEVLGKRIESIGMNPALCSHILELMEATFKRGPKVTELKLNQLPDKLRYFEVASLKPDELEGSSLEGGPDSVIITMRDITERRVIESHLLQSQKLSSLGNLVSNIAHAFNNTLTTIAGLASFASVANDPIKISRSLNQILGSAKTAGELVRGLLDFTSGSPSNLQREDLEKVISSRLELIRKIAGENYEISFTGPEKALPVDCDPNLVMQVVTNLVVNCRDAYLGKPGSIEIELDTEHMEEFVSDLHVGARPGHFARLRVRDHGCGMSPETLSKAFDPLFTTKQTSGHAGLGLSIVHAIVRAHDGFLTVESHPERGTTVSLYFPLKSGQPEKAEKPVAQERSTLPRAHENGHQERILVVEDEQSVRELVASMLSMLGYDVTICCNGQEALERYAQTKFDLVLVDMIMPRMHGMDLVSKLKSSNDKVKALVMTGYGVSAQSSAECGVLPKPFDIETLAHAVREALHPQKEAGEGSGSPRPAIHSSEL